MYPKYQTGSVSQTITNGVTITAPSENAVFDALVLKQDITTAFTRGKSIALRAAFN